MAINKINTRSIQDTTVTSDDIQDSAITNAKVSPSAAIAQSKISGLSTSISNLCSSVSTTNTNVTALNTKITAATNNIALLGFKMAVNDGLTVFNLIDGVVDEFHDESGTDEAEGSNDTYCATSDYYSNTSAGAISAGFSLTAVTEADTSTAGTNPAHGSGTPATFAYANPATLTINAWGSGGAGGYDTTDGGGGGFAQGTYSFSGPDTLYIIAGEGGGNYSSGRKNQNAFGGDHPDDSGEASGNRGGGGKGEHGGGGGLAYVGTAVVDQESAPEILIVGGAGGAGGQGQSPASTGGAGGGTTGEDGSNEDSGKGGTQSAGGEGGTGPQAPKYGQDGGFLYGGEGNVGGAGGGGGAGYYGGGGSSAGGSHSSGGGGSSYFGHPQITSGSTEDGAAGEGGGTAKTGYVACTSEGGTSPSPGGSNTDGENGYVLITGSFSVTQSSTIVSNAFAAGSVPTTSRIVVFEENIDTPTLNTDIIASISRDGGTTFTNATLADSGYVTGSSGQRILTGQATISGQPSGQSMRWKLALANNGVKIHGVALQWS